MRILFQSRYLLLLWFMLSKLIAQNLVLHLDGDGEYVSFAWRHNQYYYLYCLSRVSILGLLMLTVEV